MIYTLHPRTSVIENADKMISCGDSAFVGAMYGYPHCGKLKFVPFRCHSRFCPACGGIYARHREIDKKLHRAISHEKHHIFRNFNWWCTAILSAFGYEPLKCECGRAMLFLELCFNHKRIPLEKLYEKAMSRSHGRRPSA